MKPIPLMRASLALAYADSLNDPGVRTERAWARAGLPRQALVAPDRLVPLQQVAYLGELIAAEHDVPDFGLRVAQRSGFACTGPFGAAIQGAQTLHQAVVVTSSMACTFISGARYWLVQDRDVVRLCCRIHLPAASFRQSDLVTVALMVDLVRRVAGPGWRPKRVQLQSTGSDAFAACDLLAGATVEVGRATTSIEFPRLLLGRALPRYRAHRFTPPSTDWSQGLPPNDFQSSFEVVIGTLLESGRHGTARAAAAAGLSVRSLQRYLAETGTSYSAVVDSVRFRRARALLDDPAVKLSEVALAVGYSDQPHFTRAFRRWTSLTPLEYRQLAVDDEATLRSARAAG